MQTFSAGRRTPYIEDIVPGMKMVEGSLNHDKFSRYQPGDLVYVREDGTDASGRVEVIPNQFLITITRIGSYPTFERMLF